MLVEWKKQGERDDDRGTQVRNDELEHQKPSQGGPGIACPNELCDGLSSTFLEYGELVVGSTVVSAGLSTHVPPSINQAEQKANCKEENPNNHVRYEKHAPLKPRHTQSSGVDLTDRANKWPRECGHRTKNNE